MDCIIVASGFEVGTPLERRAGYEVYGRNGRVECQIAGRHVAYIVDQARERQALTVDVTAEAEQDWVGQVMDASLASIKFLESCTPGYHNNEGQPNGELIRRNGTYAPGIMAFSKLLEAWRGDGSLAGVEMR